MQQKPFGQTLIAVFTLILAFMPSSAAVAQSPKAAEFWNAPAIAWRDVATGIRESSMTGRPVIMLFQAEWCGSCRRYRKVWQDPGVVEAAKSFVMILVDVDESPDINGAFSPDGTYVPRTIFIDPEGDVLSQYRGNDPEFPHTIDLDDPSELRNLMQRAAAELGLTPRDTPSATPDRRAAN